VTFGSATSPNAAVATKMHNVWTVSVRAFI
jgi:hypothetical protein